MGTGWYGPTAVDALELTIERCLAIWGDDPAYKQPAQKLREVARELDALEASPGQKAAARAQSPNSTGQEPSSEQPESSY